MNRKCRFISTMKLYKKPLCNKAMLVFYLTQALTMCIPGSQSRSGCILCIYPISMHGHVLRSLQNNHSQYPNILLGDNLHHAILKQCTPCVPIMYGIHSKLVCLSKEGKWTENKKTLAYYEICLFQVTYESIMFNIYFCHKACLCISSTPT